MNRIERNDELTSRLRNSTYTLKDDSGYRMREANRLMRDFNTVIAALEDINRILSTVVEKKAEIAELNKLVEQKLKENKFEFEGLNVDG